MFWEIEANGRAIAPNEVEHPQGCRPQKDADHSARDVYFQYGRDANTERCQIVGSQIPDVLRRKLQGGKPSVEPAESKHPHHPPGQFHDDERPSVLEKYGHDDSDDGTGNSANHINPGDLLEGEPTLQMCGWYRDQGAEKQPEAHDPEIGRKVFLPKEGLKEWRTAYNGDVEDERKK